MQNKNKNADIVPGVLLLKKTFGRDKNKLIYKFLPNDKDMDIIYIPYKIKNIGFSKITYDLYTILKKQETKFIIERIIGPINVIENYYIYMMFCNNLYKPLMSIPIEKKIEIDHTPSIIDKYYYTEDRTTRSIFSIDGKTTSDYDDAISIYNNGDEKIISVYISDVYSVISHLNLWDNFTENISNIYLPNDRRILLTHEIVNKCSLTANKISTALTMDFYTNSEKVVFSITKIRPYKNYIYNEDALINDENYKEIFNYVEPFLNPDEKTSEKVIEYMMRLMCFKSGEFLSTRNKGIYRTLNIPLEDYIPSNKYITYDEFKTYDESNDESKTYDEFNDESNDESKTYDESNDKLEAYAHITSPMRRLVDIINQIELINDIYNLITEDNSKSLQFCENWKKRIDYINQTNKQIRRVQNECSLLDLYESICDQEFDGLIFDNETYSENGIWKHTVFLKDLFLLARFTYHDKLSGTFKFKLFMFDRESKFRRKIRLGLV